MITPLLIAIVLGFGSNIYAADEDLTLWSIGARVYSSRPQDKFPQLEKMGILTVNETSKGFLNRSTVFRDDYHLGATFCILIDPRVYEAQKVKERILKEINKIREEDDTVTFEITNPSNCVKESL